MKDCIKIEIPEDMELIYINGDGYSTTHDTRTLKELNAKSN